MNITVTRPQSTFTVDVNTQEVNVTTTQQPIEVTTGAQLTYNITASNTDQIPEGSTNLYYTTARVNSAFDTRLATKSTTNLAEGTNLYYTDARVRSAITAGTGVNITSGVVAIGQDVATSANPTFNNITVAGNTIKKSGGTDVISFSGTNLTTFAGDIKLMGDSVYDSLGNIGLDWKRVSSIYGTSYQAKFNTSVNYGISASYMYIDNVNEINTSSITTTSTATAILDYFDKTVYRSAKYVVQISNGSTHQVWEGMVLHDGTNIYLSAYGDLRTNGNLATMSVGFNATTGYPELRVTPVYATQTKFKATKSYIAV